MGGALNERTLSAGPKSSVGAGDVVAGHHDRLRLMAGGALLSPYLQDMPPEDVSPEDSAQFRRIATQILEDGAVGFGEMIVYHLSMAEHHSFQYAPPDHPHFLLLADIAAEHDVPIGS